MPSSNTMLILGNGFDLQCGLKSSYEDFLLWLSEDKARANANLWTVYFLNNHSNKRLWVDVEDSLRKVLTTRVNRRTAYDLWVEAAIKYYKDISGGFARVPSGKETAYIMEHIKDKGREKFPFNIHWFLDELKAFEHQFAEYIRLEVVNNSNYLGNVIKLMNMIAGDDKLNIINFNYTNPFVYDDITPESKMLNDMVAQVSNVHGTFSKDNIIFGVDHTEELPANTHIFTKTHRKIMQGNPDRALFWHINTIKFYGHSLGKADYSYFQSIFDNYNLYGGDLAYGQPRKEQVVLQFYFSIYDENKEEEIVRDAIDSVYKLITAYSATIDNKDKGKNLLHKLLLEGRLQISFLPDLSTIE